MGFEKVGEVLKRSVHFVKTDGYVCFFKRTFDSVVFLSVIVVFEFNILNTLFQSIRIRKHKRTVVPNFITINLPIKSVS